ncbi:unannotated protein [freshwater metagenome]|uniref:Unannotated protein n=1 Tax=freshwater metagenome TaxID=449393 RepID=A0A6J7LBL2_9ZZZZ
MGENTAEIATASTSPFTEVKNARVASASNGTISRPSYSYPPATISQWPPMAATSSAGQPNSGRTATEEGAPTRSTATECSRRRSSTAFVA